MLQLGRGRENAVKWVLLVHLISPGEHVEYEPLPFETKAECIAAGRAFAEKYPAFEWLDRSGEPARTEYAVFRSFVECVSAKEYRRCKYRDDDGKVE